MGYTVCLPVLCAAQSVLNMGYTVCLPVLCAAQSVLNMGYTVCLPVLCAAQSVLNMGYTVCLPVLCAAQSVLNMGYTVCLPVLCAAQSVLNMGYTVCLLVLCAAQSVLNCVWSARKKRVFFISNFRRVLNIVCNFWVFPRRLIIVEFRRFGTICLFHLQRLTSLHTSYPAFEDGTDRLFRNVGIQQ